MSAGQTLLAFLISAHAAVHAGLLAGSWSAGVSISMAAGGAILERLLFSSIQYLGTHHFLARILPLTKLGYGFLLLGVFVAAAEGEGPVLRRGMDALWAVQVLFLALGGLSGHLLGVLTNALAMVCLASLAGGWVAAGALTGYSVLLVLWLILDHHSRSGLPLSQAVRESIRWGGGVGLSAVVFFVAFPPPVYSAYRVRIDPPPEASNFQDVLGLYSDILLAVAVGALAVLLLIWFLRAVLRKRSGGPGERRARIRQAEEDRSVVEGGKDRLIVGGWRKRVLDRYLGFLREAEGLGRRRSPERTPREFAAELPGPGGALTEAFVRARYGPGEISEEEFLRADRAAEETLGELQKNLGR